MTIDGGLRRLAGGRSPTPGLLLGLVLTLAAVVAYSYYITTQIGALRTLSERTGWDLKDVDLFEVNEAFAVVAMAAMRDLDLPHDKVNVHGGACALGHPIGASGARVIVTLLSALERYGMKRGMATLCIGGGEATALAVEMH